MSRIDKGPVEKSTAGPPAQHERLGLILKAGKARPERGFTGIPICAGVGIGPVFGAAEPPAEITRHTITPDEVQAECSRLEESIERSRKQLTKLRARLGVLPEDSQAEIAPLMDAYLQMLGPSRLVRGARQRITELRLSAESAVTEEAEAIAGAILGSADPGAPDDEQASVARRAEEVREISRRLVRNLTRQPFRSFAGLPEGGVLICEGLRPADAALLNPARLAGVATEEGGADGHAAVMLRALGVPSVFGVPGLAHAAKPGDLAVVDGSSGAVWLNPSPARLASARRALTAFARERQKLARLRRLPAITRDGHEVELQANLELPLELSLIAQSGAHGIGLLRTEFLFMNRETVPDEDTQTEAYRTIIEAMNGDPVSIRVLDWGGEKDIDALSGTGLVPDEADANPALGLRGIRVLLRAPQLLETQFAAILRAAVAGPTRVMLPMITSVSEVREARALYEGVIQRLRLQGHRLPDPVPPLGIMIETPGAALSADALTLEADFLAIGTNDLTMYTVAVDRGESRVAHLYDPLHPAVLRLVQFSTEAALRMRMPVSVCGEMAANPKYTPLLLGLGLRSFSMNASAIPRVKQAVRAVEIGACARLARRVMDRFDIEQIRFLVTEFGRAMAP
ncbi:MAG: phosphoenolpyruvate--protein phosphotransferase [Acetobacteraceae bacterium]|nr:phosphoenolpyruvate--protein phosphotransferase [Acetobacteraceae bacterium]MBV8574773.1 phosphoenolpyruvate--protein phosphotransferase [Acetobacteraceae bacterium]